jgi:ABC-type branched-subunit amino acid transport system substrate-binding protein
MPLPALGGDGAAPLPAPGGAPAAPVALLLPLTGAMAPAGQALANAAKLAVPPGAGPALDIRDTASTPGGAAAAAQAAIAAGDGLILGPLTSAESHAVAPIATAAHVNMLAFTNDSGIDAPGVWALGITPAQQVRRVVQAATTNGATHFAALLPDDVFGHSLGDALNDALTTDAAAPPAITYYSAGNFSGLNQAVRQLSDFADRGQTLEDQIKAAQDLNTAAGRATALQLQHQPIPPPAFDTLFIGATDGDTLAEIATLLPYYSVNPPQVRIVGPSRWASLATAMAGQGVYNGALYAAPDPAAAASFDAKYQTAYGAPPPAIANVAFDAAALAKLAAGEGGYTSAVLTNPSGFTGTNGALLLQPDGQVLRGLAVFQIAPGAAVLASPAPAQVSAPTS